MDEVVRLKTLHHNDWLSLKMVQKDEWGSGYVYSHETRCSGNIVAILPFQKLSDGTVQYLLRSEVTPCWGEDPCVSSITGGVDGRDSPVETVVHELEEEAGIVAMPSELISLGTCRGTKSSDTTYYLFSVDALGKQRVDAKGDGSYLEAVAHCFWSESVQNAVDPLVFTMLYRLHEVLNG